jgi:hypothetical protein
MNDVEKYIAEQMKSVAKNINEFDIGCKLFDIKYNIIRVVSNKTKNSIEVEFKRASKQGIDCKNWFDMFSFNIRFRKATDKEINNEELKTKKTSDDNFTKILNSEKTKKMKNNDFIPPSVMSFTNSGNFGIKSI